MLNNNDTQELVNIIQQSDANKRAVAYMAIGYVVAKKLINVNYNEERYLDIKLAVKNIAYRINELAVINLDELYSYMMKMVDIKISMVSNDVLFLLKMDINNASFNSLYRIDKYLGTVDIDNVNNNMMLFKNCIIYFIKWYDISIEG